MVFYISGPKLLFETTEISTHPNSTQQESNCIYLYTTKFGTSIKIRLNRKFESTEFETRVNCICTLYKNIEFICTSVKKIEKQVILTCFGVSAYIYRQCMSFVSESLKQLLNCQKKSRNCNHFQWCPLTWLHLYCFSLLPISYQKTLYLGQRPYITKNYSVHAIWLHK